MDLTVLATAGSLAVLGRGSSRPIAGSAVEKPEDSRRAGKDRAITLFLCGDVMTGRGIDQVLPHSVDPRLYESYVKSALGYVQLAERVNGKIPAPVEFAYVWGDALGELERRSPHVRIINLETSITDDGEPWPGKGIHYRMHPKNVACLTAAGIDCCALANNHVLDWGYSGLEETLRSLDQAGLRHAGAGRDQTRAEAPAVIEIDGGGRVLVFSFGHGSSGIPRAWAAQRDRPGVDLLRDFSGTTVRELAGRVRAVWRPGDLVVASVHWGGNWGYAVPTSHRDFARALIDDAGVHVVHGHSSHHPRAIEVHRGRPILYGCGDFINDYEGIGGKEEFRPDLTLMYLPAMDPANGELVRFEMVPLQMRRFRLNRISQADALWLARSLDRECGRFGAAVRVTEQGSLSLKWQA